MFLLILPTRSLLEALRKCFFFLLISNSIFIAVLRLNLWFSGFNTTRNRNFYKKNFGFLPIFHVFKFCQIITLLTVQISYSLVWKWGTIDNLKILKDIDYDFKGFGTTFSKNLFDFLKNFSVNCRFCFVLLVLWNLLFFDLVSLAFHRRID